MARPGGLGKGLSALIPAGESTKDDGGGGGDARLVELAIDAIVPNPNQPRVHFDEESLNDLAASIRELGVLQPILVRPAGTGYELLAGERRWRAARRAGLSVVPAVVRVTDDLGSVERALVENLHRQDLTPLEEAAAYQQLIEDFEFTHEQVAQRVGKSRSAVSNMLRLLTLPPSIQHLLADGGCPPVTPRRCWVHRTERSRSSWRGERSPRGGRSGPSRRRCAIAAVAWAARHPPTRTSRHPQARRGRRPVDDCVHQGCWSSRSSWRTVCPPR